MSSSLAMHGPSLVFPTKKPLRGRNGWCAGASDTTRPLALKPHRCRFSHLSCSRSTLPKETPVRTLLSEPWRRRSRVLQVDRGGLAGALVGLKLVGNLLALAQTAHAGPLERGRVHEHVLAAVIRLNEAVALGFVVPLHRSGTHGGLPCRRRLHVGGPHRRPYPISRYW